MNIQVLFGRNLERLRTGAKLSQLDLATETNLALNFINDIEKGRKWVSAKTIEKFAKTLNAKPFQFLIDPEELDDHEKETVKFYLADIADGVTKMVKEYQNSYLAEEPENEKK